MKRLTLEEIGKLAGVSRSTVSRVINNHSNISPEAKARVEKVIAETGFVPNSAARSLASSQTGVLGLIIPAILNTTFADPYYSQLIQGITSACHEYDYTAALYLFQTEAREQETVKSMISGHMVDGLIITTDNVYDTYASLMNQYMAPVIQLGAIHSEDAKTINYVDVDNIAGAYMATSHLIQKGKRRIAHIAVDDNSAGIDRFAGYQRALSENGLAFDNDLVAYGDFTEPTGYRAMQGLLDKKPDALFASSDWMAMGAIRAIQETGLSVPEDVAVVGFDDMPNAGNFDIPLTTIRQPIFQQGVVLIETLIDIIKTSSEPARHVVLPVELIVRASS